MCMGTADLKKRDVALIQPMELHPDEMGNQHAFSRALHEDGRIGEEEIAMGCPKITSSKLRGLIVVAKRL